MKLKRLCSSSQCSMSDGCSRHVSKHVDFYNHHLYNYYGEQLDGLLFSCGYMLPTSVSIVSELYERNKEQRLTGPQEQEEVLS